MAQYGLDPVSNFAIAQLSSGMAASATSFSVVTGQGALFPDPSTLGSYNVTIWNATDYANPSDDPTKIIFRVTAKSSDTFTGSSSQEGGGAYAQNTAGKVYKVSLGVTAKMISDIETLGYSNMSKNAIMNPEAFLWQRFTAATGTTNPASDTSTADRWKSIYSVDGGTLPTTIIHRRATLTAGESYGLQHAYELNYDGAGSGFGANAYYCTYQKIENGTQKLCGAGKYITLSFWAKSNVAGKKIGVYVNQTYGTGGSPSGTEVLTGTTFTLTSTLTRYSCTFATNTLTGKTFGTNNDDSLQILFTHQWGSNFGAYMNTGVAETFVGSGYTYVTGVMVSAGSFPFKYTPTPIGEEISRCQRYYRKSYDTDTIPGTATSTGALFQGMNNDLSGDASIQLYFAPEMRTTPTMTYYRHDTGASGSLLASTSGAAYGTFTPTSALGKSGGHIYNTGGTSGQFVHMKGHYTADAEF